MVMNNQELAGKSLSSVNKAVGEMMGVVQDWDERSMSMNMDSWEDVVTGMRAWHVERKVTEAMRALVELQSDLALMVKERGE